MLPCIDPRLWVTIEIGPDHRASTPRLAEDVDGPQASGMGGIAFEIDGTPHVALDQTPHAWPSMGIAEAK